MKYEKILKAEFISRPNRFVAQVKLNGEEITVHVKNTGRCRELLVPGAAVYLEDFTYRRGKRKLAYDLVAVEKGNLLINMDSQAPNKTVMEALENGSLSLLEMDELSYIKAEKTYMDSRFDFYVKDINGKKGFAEVKGVTLEQDGVALFPDAPTERGVKHLNGLISARKNGYYSYIIFIIQMSGMKYFTPNEKCHAAFASTLKRAAQNGVSILAYSCRVAPDSLTLDAPIPIRL